MNTPEWGILWIAIKWIAFGIAAAAVALVAVLVVVLVFNFFRGIISSAKRRRR